jgi:hypothetical protein
LWIPPGQRERLTRPDDAERFTARPVVRRGGGPISHIPIIESEVVQPEKDAQGSGRALRPEQQSTAETKANVAPPRQPEALAAAGGAELSIGEPAYSKALIRCGEAEPASDPGFSADSSVDPGPIPDGVRRDADNRAPFMNAAGENGASHGGPHQVAASQDCPVGEAAPAAEEDRDSAAASSDGGSVAAEAAE